MSKKLGHKLQERSNTDVPVQWTLGRRTSVPQWRTINMLQRL